MNNDAYQAASDSVKDKADALIAALENAATVVPNINETVSGVVNAIRETTTYVIFAIEDADAAETPSE